MKKSNLTMDIEVLAKKLQTASDPNRLKILCYIFNAKKACVSDVANELNMSVAITSHHLLALSKEGLLTSVREGKKICYSLLEDTFVQDFKNLICKYK